MIFSDFGGPEAHFGGPGAHFKDFLDFCDFGDVFRAKGTPHFEAKVHPVTFFAVLITNLQKKRMKAQ